jgi:hypothetical protein
MAFKYKKHEFQDNEVIDPIKITENMRTLANEINGNLDRDNLPMKCISSSMLADNCTSSIVSFHDNVVNNSDLMLKNSSTSWEPCLTKTYTMQHDGVIFVHYGCEVEWFLDDTALNRINFNDSPINTDSTEFVAQWETGGNLRGANYYITGNFVIEFQITVNGIIISQSGQFDFARRQIGVYLSGVLPVSAGSTDIRILRRVRRILFKNEITEEKVAATFYPQINRHQMVSYLKWR